MGYLFKFILLAMVYNIYVKSKNAILPASTWAILSFFMPSYMRESLDINIFICAGISFFVGYTIFWLAKYFSTSMWELPILVLGLVLLWLI